MERRRLTSSLSGLICGSLVRCLLFTSLLFLFHCFLVCLLLLLVGFSLGLLLFGCSLFEFLLLLLRHLVCLLLLLLCGLVLGCRVFLRILSNL